MGAGAVIDRESPRHSERFALLYACFFNRVQSFRPKPEFSRNKPFYLVIARDVHGIIGRRRGISKNCCCSIDCVSSTTSTLGASPVM